MAGEVEQIIQILGIILAVGAAIYLMARQAKQIEEMQKRLQRKVKRVTIIQCAEGAKKRDFKEGDYVGLRVECPGEEGEGYIISIYAEEEGQEKSKKAGGKPPATLTLPF